MGNQKTQWSKGKKVIVQDTSNPMAEKRVETPLHKTVRTFSLTLHKWHGEEFFCGCDKCTDALIEIVKANPKPLTDAVSNFFKTLRTRHDSGQYCECIGCVGRFTEAFAPIVAMENKG